MSEMKHSPLPWKVLTDEETGQIQIVQAKPRIPPFADYICEGMRSDVEQDVADAEFIVTAVNSHAANQQLITRLTEALADAVRCVGHLHTNDCPMQNYETPCKCWVTPARDALDAAAVAKERAG